MDMVLITLAIILLFLIDVELTEQNMLFLRFLAVLGSQVVCSTNFVPIIPTLPQLSTVFNFSHCDGFYPRLQDAWDATSDEDDSEKSAAPVKVKKKKTLAQKIAEKEAKREEEELEDLLAQEEDTPEARLAAKMKMQRLAEEEDRDLFKDLVGAEPAMGQVSAPGTRI